MFQEGHPDEQVHLVVLREAGKPPFVSSECRGSQFRFEPVNHLSS